MAGIATAALSSVKSTFGGASPPIYLTSYLKGGSYVSSNDSGSIATSLPIYLLSFKGAAKKVIATGSAYTNDDTLPWTNPGNIIVPDNTSATVSVGNGSSSAIQSNSIETAISNGVPSDATIDSAMGYGKYGVTGTSTDKNAQATINNNAETVNVSLTLNTGASTTYSASLGTTTRSTLISTGLTGSVGAVNNAAGTCGASADSVWVEVLWHRG